MEYVVSIILGFATSLLAAEIATHRQRWCEFIIKAAARRLPDGLAQIKREEWLADLNDRTDIISSFWHAMGCWIAAPTVAKNSNVSLEQIDRKEKDLIGVGGFLQPAWFYWLVLIFFLPIYAILLYAIFLPVGWVLRKLSYAGRLILFRVKH